MGYGTQLLDTRWNFARQKDFLRITLLTDRLDKRPSNSSTGTVSRKAAMVPMRWLAERRP